MSSQASSQVNQTLLTYPDAQNEAKDSQGTAKPSLNTPQAILDYLRNRLPGYPFDPQLDEDYVEELVNDFPDINILAEVKTFRWYYNNKPFSAGKQPRVALRRWLDNAWPAT